MGEEGIVAVVAQIGLVVEEEIGRQLAVLVVGGQNVERPGPRRAVPLKEEVVVVVESTAASVEELLHSGQEKAQLAQSVDLPTNSDRTFVVERSELNCMVALTGTVLAQARRHLREVEGIAD